jgi:hypothetical protein
MATGGDAPAGCDGLAWGIGKRTPEGLEGVKHTERGCAMHAPSAG